GIVRSSIDTGMLLEANSALLRIFGVSDLEEAKTSISSLADAERITRLLRQNGRVDNFETQFRRKDGSVLWVSFSGKLFSKEGYLEGVIVDITARKQAEEQIREQAALLDKGQDAIMVCDIDNKVLYWNKSAERLYGWPIEEVLEKNISNIILNKETKPQFDHACLEVLKKGEWNGELKNIAKSGKEIILASRWTLVRDNEGNPKSILMVNTDVTEKKMLEVQFLRAQRMESIGILAGGIAHDLNNVLSPILMSVEILKKKLGGDDLGRKVLGAVEASAKRGADMVKQVLTFARGIDGQRVEIQIRHVIGEVFQIAKETFPKSIDLRTNVPRELWQILGDTTQLHQVILNLIVNARDAMPKGGPLTISAENTILDEAFAKLNPESKAGPYVLVSVADAGIGISQSDQDKIFEPFFTTKEVGKGTGLGLSTALGIVKSHGGFIKVESNIGKGSTFKIYLPAALGVERRETKESEVEIHDGQGELVLIVDDEKTVRDISKATLEEHGYKVLTANDGLEAVDIYRDKKDDVRVVLTDMMMPRMDGASMIKALRGINPQVKIIATSGLTAVPDQGSEASIKAARAFLSKPFTTETLLRTLYHVLNENGTQVESRR
ncbi:MAG TPA: PAS domain S-box protein, partial [Bacteroidota bacterium]|nr:PAS domain S-box protein [Bacteroidota bacterium]